MKTSFTEILSRNNIVIPIIQRDYAQGRTDVKTEKIRKDFLDAIFEVLKERINGQTMRSLELDFIYGFSTNLENKTTFAPIDGQQRLTTLWLLLWYISVRENISKDERQLLANFKYETRHSTTVFCEQLIRFNPAFKGSGIGAEIINQSWYFESWDFDPSIKAMIVMLKDIENRYLELKYNEIWNIFNHPTNPFYFYKLDMEKVGLPDDLYIKMNSRGKPLTEFEYFKAGFLDIIKNEVLKKRFEDSIDQKWAECMWAIVLEKAKNTPKIDIALLVDDCFIRFINYISDILAYKQGLPFVEINHSTEETKGIYQNEGNLIFLFDVLDCIVELHNSNPNFWNDTFYMAKDEFALGKTRLFFQQTQINLLEKCLYSYSGSNSGFSFPEQLLLFGVIIHLLKKTSHFSKAARIIRNLVANSENELRDATIGLNFIGVEQFVQYFKFDNLVHFKRDQIKEEEDKYNYINQNSSAEAHIYLLEDSDIFRGCISIFDLDEKFISRKGTFMSIFDEDLILSDFLNRSNLLLSFGDYSQAEGNHKNLLACRRNIWRRFLTTPGFNKIQITKKTKNVLMSCLDFFCANSSVSIHQYTDNTLLAYENKPKDWIYYFLKYYGFRENCNQGYFYWGDVSHYPMYKMKEKQFNGYHWDPFLSEIKKKLNTKALELDNGRQMTITIGDEMLQIECHSKCFLIKEVAGPTAIESTFAKLVKDEIISNEGWLLISQNTDKIDTEDRVEKGIKFIERILLK